MFPVQCGGFGANDGLCGPRLQHSVVLDHKPGGLFHAWNVNPANVFVFCCYQEELKYARPVVKGTVFIAMEVMSWAALCR